VPKVNAKQKDFHRRTEADIHALLAAYDDDIALGGVLSHLAWQSRAPLRRDRADCHPWGGGNIQRSHLVHRPWQQDLWAGESNSIDVLSIDRG
jgi:hypothetical protein